MPDVQEAPHKVRTYDVLVELHGWQEPVAAIRAAFKKGDTDAMAEAVSDEMLEAISIYGTLEEARQRLAARTCLPQLRGLCLDDALSGRNGCPHHLGSTRPLGGHVR